MQEFIDMAASQFGISQDSAKSATGGLLNYVKDQVSDGDFDQLAGAVPGLSDVLGATGASEGGGGGGLGGLMGAAAGMLGGQAGGALGVLGMLQSAGLSMDQVGSFVPMLVSFLKGQAGDGVVDSLIGQIPELKKLLG